MKLFQFQANAYKDTLPNDVTNITYEPRLATFEMDIMQVIHIFSYYDVIRVKREPFCEFLGLTFI